MTEPQFTASALGKMLGVSAVHVGRMGKEGQIPRRKNGKYGPEAVLAYVTKLREDSRRRTDYSEEIDAEKVRKLRRENDQAEGILAPIQVLQAYAERIATVVVPILENIPLNLKRSFPELTGDQIQIIKAGIAEARNAIADAEIEL